MAQNYNYLSNRYNKYYSQQYNKLSNAYERLSNKYNTEYSPSNPAKYTISKSENKFLDSLMVDYRKSITPAITYEREGKRTNWDRFGDALNIGVYPIAGAVKNLIDSDASTTFGGGIAAGIKAANPLGAGYTKGETTWSDVYGEAGWNPTSLPGKIAKGALGFLGDVFLDPTTYLSFGVGALLKGTGKAGVATTHAIAAKKIMEKYGIDIAEGVTEKAAREIVAKYSLDVEKVVLKEDELVETAKAFMDKYNDLTGANRKARGITLSLKNAPLGDKIFGKKALKSKELISGESIQKLSDKTIAPYYAKLRNGVYGSKLAKIIPSAPLYQASKTNPEAVYNLVRFMDANRGLTVDKIMADKKGN